jgi:WD40 repeat protein
MARAKAVLKLALEGHEKPVLCIAFHPKRIIASGSADRSIKIWRPAPTWQLVNNL